MGHPQPESGGDPRGLTLDASRKGRAPAARKPAVRKVAARGRRWGSVLVLVMTLLSILFVIGVAFLATMNFEAESIASEKLRAQNESGTDAVAEVVGQRLRQGFMSDDQVPFGDAAAGSSVTGYAALPGWHDTTSPIEPNETLDRATGTPVMSFPWITDPQGMTRTPFSGPTFLGANVNTAWIDGEPQTVTVLARACTGGINNGNFCVNDAGCPGTDPVTGNPATCSSYVCDSGANAGNPCIPTIPNVCPPDASSPSPICAPLVPVGFDRVCPAGVNEGMPCYTDGNCGCGGEGCPVEERCFVCIGGINDGESCDASLAGDCPNGTCGQPIVAVDADGDGVVDTVQMNAKAMGFSESQIAEISSVVNPPTKKNGKVFVGLRTVAHGGMVNLNDSHPKLIETVLHVPSVHDPNTAAFGDFYHRPTLASTFEAYSPAAEEPGLRRRNLLPPRRIPPSRLMGNGELPIAALIARPNADGDMPKQLLPYIARAQEYESARELLADGRPGHRYWPFLPRPDRKGAMEFEEAIPGAGSASLWQSRMEPFTARDVALGMGRIPTLMDPSYDYREYDKRHLVTTISHDDLLSRGGTVYTPTGRKDIRQAMIEANRTNPDACATSGADYPFLPFEYVDYPTELRNTSKPESVGTDDECDCPSKTGCVFDRRKGRLQLSLPWLDYAMDPAQNFIYAEQRNRLIYEAFMMLLSNASGPAWEGKCRTGLGPTGGDCLPWEECRSLGVGDQGTCVDLVLNQPHRLAMISRTAASLTANLIDYMDLDPVSGSVDEGIPTRIALRSFDFSEGAVCHGGVHNGLFCPDGNEYCLDPVGTNDGTCLPTTATCVGGADAGDLCPNGDMDCSGGRCSATPNVGREINVGTPASPRYVYVYGLERQPFITEVASVTNAAGIVEGRAVEIFNPFNEDINLSDYSLVERDKDGGANHEVTLTGTLQAGTFGVIWSDDVNNGTSLLLNGGAEVPSSATIWQRQGGSGAALTFTNGGVVYLVRTIPNVSKVYDEPPGSESWVTTKIVVDQFDVSGTDIALDHPPGKPASDTNPFLVTMERTASPTRPWSSPVPHVKETSGAPSSPSNLPQTLGQANSFNDNLVHNVELYFADTGSLTRPVNVSTLNYTTAFPTTGSLLLLPRHANRSLDDLTLTRRDGGLGPLSASLPFKDRFAVLKNLAFTWWLDRSHSALADDTSTGLHVLQATILEREQIDNGRMPIFDVGSKGIIAGTGAAFFSAHHVPARQDADGNPTAGQPGELANLPWGQLVFDYFTALPLRNPGPYRVDGITTQKAAPESQPHVDLGGLRVHGRIDLNAAPWTVLRGLPLAPMAQFRAARMHGQLELREKLQAALLPQYYDVKSDPPQVPVTMVEDVGSLMDERAQGIVAYREAREAIPSAARATTVPTGDYSLPQAGRSWADTDPAFRRGMGFMTVGELANVRLDDGSGTVPPGNAAYRIDGGLVRRDLTVPPTPPYDASAHDYLNAAATLIALGDWVTVRSQVQTVYGVIRGEEDETIVDPKPERQSRLRRQDVQARSLRFQETMDRIPTFFGSQRPSRIGERVIAKYRDFQND